MRRSFSSVSNAQPERGRQSRAPRAVASGVQCNPLTAAAAEATGAVRVLIGNNRDRECFHGAKSAALAQLPAAATGPVLVAAARAHCGVWASQATKPVHKRLPDARYQSACPG